MKKSSVFSKLYQDLYRIRFALLILLAYAVPTQLIFHTICPFAILTGFPCPACGLTRAGICLLRGAFADAWRIQPAIYLWFPMLLYFGLFRYVLGKRIVCARLLVIMVCLGTFACYFCRLAAGNTVFVPCAGILPCLLHIPMIE